MNNAGSTAQQSAQRRSFADTLELDKRLFGMLIAFAILCGVFHLATHGTFLTPRNIFNISVQTVSVGIMATGMVFVIVARHIDLSVGSMLAICSAVMAILQTRFLPRPNRGGSSFSSRARSACRFSHPTGGPSASTPRGKSCSVFPTRRLTPSTYSRAGISSNPARST